MQKYYLNNREVSEEEFYSINNLSVSNPFRGEKQVNQAVKEAIGLSTRHKAGEKMVYLDEVLDNFREDDSPAIKFAERLAQQDERLKEIKDRLNLAEKQARKFIDDMYLKNPNVISQEEYDKLEKEDTITNVSRGEKEMIIGEVEKKASKVLSELFKKDIDSLTEMFTNIKPEGIKETEGKVGEKMTKLDEAIAQWKELIDGAVEAQHGVKETEGKLNYELDWEFIQQMAERMSQNKGKYEPYNWKKPMDVEKLKQSLFRHVIEVMKGNYSDDGREFGHLESIALNSMMINYQLKNKQ
jgi:hypothetical protein